MGDPILPNCTVPLEFQMKPKWEVCDGTLQCFVVKVGSFIFMLCFHLFAPEKLNFKPPPTVGKWAK